MFIVNISGRQSGSTWKTKQLIKEDVGNGLRVGIVGKKVEFERITSGISDRRFLVNFCEKCDFLAFNLDKIYILEFNNMTEKALNNLRSSFPNIRIHCNYTLNKKYRKLNFDIAKYLRSKESVSTSEITLLLKNIDSEDVDELEYLIKNPLTRSDVEIVLQDNSYCILERLGMCKGLGRYEKLIDGNLFY